MSSVLPYLILFGIILVVVFHIFGLHTADWGEPITATDFYLGILALFGVIALEVRYAARWVVEQLSK